MEKRSKNMSKTKENADQKKEKDKRKLKINFLNLVLISKVR